MAKYTPAWELLKLHGHVTLAVPVPLHKRVWRGLINCKDRDLGFKLLAQEEKKRYILSYVAEQARFRVIMKSYPMLEAISVEDL